MAFYKTTQQWLCCTRTMVRVVRKRSFRSWECNKIPSLKSNRALLPFDCLLIFVNNLNTLIDAPTYCKMRACVRRRRGESILCLSIRQTEPLDLLEAASETFCGTLYSGYFARRCTAKKTGQVFNETEASLRLQDLAANTDSSPMELPTYPFR